jgi:hypothetical protein
MELWNGGRAGRNGRKGQRGRHHGMGRLAQCDAKAKAAVPIGSARSGRDPAARRNRAADRETRRGYSDSSVSIPFLATDSSEFGMETFNAEGGFQRASSSAFESGQRN